MPERRGEKKSSDPFEQYRNSKSRYWGIVEPSITNIFGEKIPDDLKPHLIEFSVIRGSGYDRETTNEETNKLISQFSDAHDLLFNNSLFISAVKKISERFPLAG